MVKRIPIPSYLSVLVHFGGGTPIAFRVNLARVRRWCVGGVLTLCLLVTGSLLFFRELEINRKLEERLLELETERKIASLAILTPRSVAQEAPSALVPERAQSVSNPPPSSDALPGATVAARIADFGVSCEAGDCLVRFALAPATPGTAAGHLLVVLEAELPRIGAGNPSMQTRKRFFIYPGTESREELTPSTLVKLERKPFRTARSLQTSTRFEIGKLVRPLAVNIYLFDTKGTLLRHERKSVETE